MPSPCRFADRRPSAGCRARSWPRTGGGLPARGRCRRARNRPASPTSSAWPSTAIAPALGSSSPDRQRIKVVLPAPFEPMMQTSSPAATSRLDIPQHLHVAVAGLHVGDRKFQRRFTHGCPPGLWRIFAAEIGFDTRLSLITSLRLALGDQLAVVQHDHALRDRQHDLHQMLDDDDGDAALRDLRIMPSASSISVGLSPALTSSSISRRGLHGEALGQLEALAAAPASATPPAGRPASARPVKARCSRACACASRHAAGAAREQRAGRDILQHGHLRERLHDLEGAREAEPRDLVRLHARDVAALETHPTARCRMHAGDQVDRAWSCRRRSVRSGRRSRPARARRSRRRRH